MTPRVSVVIPAYNGAVLTRRCLDRLIEQELDAEIVVVDDASTDETEVMLSGYDGKITVLRNEMNTGFATATNRGVAASSGEVLVFLNNDTEPVDGWLDALLGHLDAHPEAGVVGCKLLYPDGRIQHAGVAFGPDGIPYHLYNGFPGDHPATNRSRRFQVVTAACMAVPRSVFDRLGGFDEGYVNSAEDVDLCLRAGELGYEVHYCADAVVVHLESATRGRGFQRQSELLFRQRWADRVRRDELELLVEDGLLTVEHTENARLILGVDPAVGRVAEADPLAAERVIDEVTARWLRAELERDRLQTAQRQREVVPIRFDSVGDPFPADRPDHWADGAAAWPRYDFLRRKCAPLALRVVSRTPVRVNLLYEGLASELLFAGHAAVLQLAAVLAGRGRRVRLVGTDLPSGHWPLDLAVNEIDGGERLIEVEYLDASDRSRPLTVSADDRFVATSWWTMRVAHAAAAQLGTPPPLWLIQEYEPLFYPAGAYGAMCRTTYDLPHVPVVSTELLRDYLVDHRVGGLSGDRPQLVFRNPLTSLRAPVAADLARPSVHRVLAYLRGAPRNAAEVVLAAIDLATRRGDLPPDWHVTGVGGDLTGDQRIELPSGRTVEMFDRLSPGRYRAMLRSHDIGLALQDTPHPGMVTLDLAAAGLTAITSVFGNKTASALAAISTNIVGVEPDPVSVADALAVEVARVGEVERRVAGARFDWPRSAVEAYPPEFADRLLRLMDGEPAAEAPG